MPTYNFNAVAIEAGDIMLKRSDGSAVNNIIRLGQFLGSGPSEFTHAGIASSPNSIIEMDGAGLQENDLAGHNATYTYDVFRCRYPRLAAGAAESAKMMYEGVKAYRAGQSNMRVSYDLTGAAASIFRSTGWDGGDLANSTLDVLLSGNGTAFFCSGHVVLCYQMTFSQAQIEGILPSNHARRVFSLEANCYQPSFLWQSLDRSVHFGFAGKFRGGRRVQG